MKTLKILETEISDTTVNEVCALLIEKNNLKVAICNANTLVQSVKNLNLREAVNKFDIKTPDGYPVAKARSYLKNSPFERVDGYKVFLKTIETGLESNTKHFFFGSSKVITDKMCKKLKEKYPTINISGVFNPEILDVDKLTLKYQNFFHDVETDIVWVSLGFPKQELFINNINSNNNNFVGVGAVFEWVAGTKVKAPEWIADIGLEWILRLIQEPKRLFKRYLIDNTLFIYYFLKQILK
jgi:N-acetylglucosaminyldiphosphoundecaprenol N-acetyl-beta-D-mannosaminyltransferase